MAKPGRSTVRVKLWEGEAALQVVLVWRGLSSGFAWAAPIVAPRAMRTWDRNMLSWECT